MAHEDSGSTVVLKQNTMVISASKPPDPYRHEVRFARAEPPTRRKSCTKMPKSGSASDRPGSARTRVEVPSTPTGSSHTRLTATTAAASSPIRTKALVMLPKDI